MEEEPEAPGATTHPDGTDVALSSVERDLAPHVAVADRAGLREGNATFALDLYRRLRAGDDGEENVFFSPHSMSIALAMTYAGAEGETERQMAEVMHYGLAEPELHEAFNELDLALATRSNRLDVINATWGQVGYHFLPEYLDTLSLNYGAAMYLLDYMADAEGSRHTINDWVAAQTEDRIEELLRPGIITVDTRLVLTNAIYFNAPWQIQFNEDETTTTDFTLDDGSTVSVDMMSLVDELNFGHGPGWSAVELPYEDGELSMVAVLPAASDPDFDRTLDLETLDAIIDSLEPTEDVEVRMPRFSFGAEMRLDEHLYEMGMVDAFTWGLADFSGMDGTGQLVISAIVHKAWIDVTESGTEAAAATAVVVSNFAALPIVTFDRPFIFMIRDIETGAILFLGRVADPTAE